MIAPAQGRRFAWTLAAGFAVLAALGLWRGRVRTAELFVAIASLAFVAGALFPARLGPVERAWTLFGESLSRVTSPIFFSILYLIVLTPVGVLRRTLARSPLARSRDAKTFWIERPVVSPEAARASLEHLF